MEALVIVAIVLGVLGMWVGMSIMVTAINDSEDSTEEE